MSDARCYSQGFGSAEDSRVNTLAGGPVVCCVLHPPPAPPSCHGVTRSWPYGPATATRTHGVRAMPGRPAGRKARSNARAGTVQPHRDEPQDARAGKPRPNGPADAARVNEPSGRVLRCGWCGSDAASALSAPVQSTRPSPAPRIRRPGDAPLASASLSSPRSIAFPPSTRIIALLQPAVPVSCLVLPVQPARLPVRNATSGSPPRGRPDNSSFAALAGPIMRELPGGNFGNLLNAFTPS